MTSGNFKNIDCIVNDAWNTKTIVRIEGNVFSAYSINYVNVINIQRVSINLSKKNSKRRNIRIPIHRIIKTKGSNTHFKMHVHSWQWNYKLKQKNTTYKNKILKLQCC